jgi:HD-GYP domain-containing protein (c-di-GMP phosphodiesterase class II)
MPWVNTERRYHSAVSISEAKEEIQRASGALIDPKVVNAFLGIPEGVWADLIQEISKTEEV